MRFELLTMDSRLRNKKRETARIYILFQYTLIEGELKNKTFFYFFLFWGNEERLVFRLQLRAI